jgi:hypothetical protein
VRSYLDAQFWAQEQGSAASPVGVVRTLPCEPPPLTQNTPSGKH